MSHTDSPFGNFHLRTDIPYFSGDYVDWWIYHVKCFFYHRQVSAEEKIHIAEIFLVREALQWYEEWEWLRRRCCQQITWEDFESSLRARFESVETLKPQTDAGHSILKVPDEAKEITMKVLKPTIIAEPVIDPDAVSDDDGKGEITDFLVSIKLDCSLDTEIELDSMSDEDETTFDEPPLELSSIHRRLTNTHQGDADLNLKVSIKDSVLDALYFDDVNGGFVASSYGSTTVFSVCIPAVCENVHMTIISDFHLICCCTDVESCSCKGLSQFALPWYEEPPPMPPDIAGILSIHNDLLIKCSELGVMAVSANGELVCLNTAKETFYKSFVTPLCEHSVNGISMCYYMDMIWTNWESGKSVWWSLKHTRQSSLVWIIGYLLHFNMHQYYPTISFKSWISFKRNKHIQVKDETITYLGMRIFSNLVFVPIVVASLRSHIQVIRVLIMEISSSVSVTSEEANLQNLWFLFVTKINLSWLDLNEIFSGMSYSLCKSVCLYHASLVMEESPNVEVTSQKREYIILLADQFSSQSDYIFVGKKTYGLNHFLLQAKRSSDKVKCEVTLHDFLDLRHPPVSISNGKRMLCEGDWNWHEGAQQAVQIISLKLARVMFLLESEEGDKRLKFRAKVRRRFMGSLDIILYVYGCCQLVIWYAYAYPLIYEESGVDWCCATCWMLALKVPNASSFQRIILVNAHLVTFRFWHLCATISWRCGERIDQNVAKENNQDITTFRDKIIMLYMTTNSVVTIGIPYLNIWSLLHVLRSGVPEAILYELIFLSRGWMDHSSTAYMDDYSEFNTSMDHGDMRYVAQDVIQLNIWRVLSFVDVYTEFTLSLMCGRVDWNKKRQTSRWVTGALEQVDWIIQIQVDNVHIITCRLGIVFGNACKIIVCQTGLNTRSLWASAHVILQIVIVILDFQYQLRYWFSKPSPTEMVDLEDKVISKGEGMMRIKYK